MNSMFRWERLDAGGKIVEFSDGLWMIVTVGEKVIARLKHLSGSWHLQAGEDWIEIEQDQYKALAEALRGEGYTK